MVSVGKLSAGQARYYLDQAGGPVTAAGALTSGVEDYYLGGPEAAGRWLGRGARALGLDGRVQDDALHAVLAGDSPVTGEILRTRGSVAGFDVTFSAPKSVSVLFGIGDPATQSAIHDAHARAVREAFAYFERSTAFARRGAGGAETVRGDGLVAAAFVHRTSRSGDPQLHTHVLVANLVRAEDGRWSALDGRLVYAHARTAGFLYQAALRAELTRSLGVEWTPVSKGSAEIRGVSSRVIRAFSRRRAEIEAAMELHGSRGRHAAQVAALDTRRAKDRAVRPEALAPEWRLRAAKLGLRRGADRATTRPGDARADRLGRGVRRAGGADGSDAERIDLRAPRGPPGALPARGPGRDGAGARARRRRVPALAGGRAVGQRPASRASLLDRRAGGD